MNSTIYARKGGWEVSKILEGTGFFTHMGERLGNLLTHLEGRRKIFFKMCSQRMFFIFGDFILHFVKNGDERGSRQKLIPTGVGEIYFDLQQEGEM